MSVPRPVICSTHGTILQEDTVLCGNPCQRIWLRASGSVILTMSRSAARSTWPSASELAPSSVAQPAVKRNSAWQLWPSEHQIPAKQYTHTRPVPLPLSIHIRINGIDCDGQYEGHGQSKVAFLLSADDSVLSGKILKLCDKVDHEPHLFAELSSTGLYPEIY